MSCISAMRDSGARRYTRREPSTARSASSAASELCSHQRLQRPGWNWPSSSAAQTYTGTCAQGRALTPAPQADAVVSLA